MSLNDDKQQNIQMELDFSSALTGAARRGPAPITSYSASGAGTIMLPSGPWPSNGFASCFAAGTIA